MKKERWVLYLRVSTVDQNTDIQKNDLERYALAQGWSYEIIEDKASGTLASRSGLDKLMKMARRREIDGLAIWKLDRLFRSLKNAVNNLNELNELGIKFYSHNDNLDFSTPTGRLMTHLLMVFSEFERDSIVLRVKAGLANAKAKGVRLGRPERVTKEIQDKVIVLANQGLSLRQIEKALHKQISRGSVFRILKEAKALLQKPNQNPSQKT